MSTWLKLGADTAENEPKKDACAIKHGTVQALTDEAKDVGGKIDDHINCLKGEKKEGGKKPRKRTRKRRRKKRR